MKFPKSKPIRDKALYNQYRERSQGALCEYCKSDYAVDVHHIIFKSRGGSDLPINLIALCRECHNRAHSSDSRTFRIKLQLVKEGKYDKD